VEKKASEKIMKKGILFFLAAALLFPFAVQAASLYFSPSSGSYTVGSTFSLGVYVSSTDKAMNAASGIVSFAQDKLEVTSLSRSSSIMSLWVQEPLFSNAAGTVNFEGIVLNPGYTGGSGQLLSINFRVKAPGTASAIFSSGSVLANDGYGTSILTGLGTAEFSLIPTTLIPAPQPSRVGVPSAPVIRSSTHPDSEKWYPSSAAVFSWDVPLGVDAARLLVGQSPSSVPNVLYIPPINSRDVSDIALADGVWYFHAQLRNPSGYGGTSHFKFQIDTTKPSYFNLTQQAREDATYPRVSFLVDAADETSGIDHYEFQIDEGEAVVWKDSGRHIFETIALAPGEHRLLAKAVDKAGNYLADSLSFIIEPLQSPILTQYPSVVKTGQAFLVQGTAHPTGTVTLWFQRGKDDPEHKSVSADKKGDFTFTFEEGLKEPGTYKLWAEVTDQRGARSLPSEKVSLKAESPAFIEFGYWITTVLAIVIPIVALLLLLAALLLYAWQKFVAWKKRIRKEVREADRALHKAIDMLKEDISVQIKLLEKTKSKRELTEEEEKIIKQLKKDVDQAEKFVKKEIQDIEKEVQ
jgi:hypothetical protein